MTHTERTYLPAAGHDWALPFYDPLVKLMGADDAKRALLDQAALQPTHRILDIGCGTGTLAVLIKRLYGNAEVVGLDPDPKALERARHKAAAAALPVRLDQGFANELPYPDASFDRVFSSFMFHHLGKGQREKTSREVRRVLAPGGSFHLLDFVCPAEASAGWWDRLVFSSSHFKDNSDSRILAVLSQGGFASARKIKDAAIFFGLLHVIYYQACAPTAGGEPEE